MDKHFTVTIHDDDGVKQFNLHNIIKKVGLYTLIGILSSFIMGISAIIYLNNSVNEVQTKKSELKNEVDSLKSLNTHLQTTALQVEKDLIGKKEELLSVSDKLESIEEMIGLLPSKEVEDITNRVNLAAITSAKIAKTMELIPNGSPVEYKGVTSKYGYRIHPKLKKRIFHTGIDLRATMKTPVYATADGVVEFAGYNKGSGYGNLVIIDHNYGFKTLYGHLKKTAVKSATFIKKGTLIGYSGNSGLSSGPHLHYEIRFIQQSKNPFWFIKWSATNYNEIFEKEKKIPWQSLITALTT
ncbi:MAG: M23 family metallopeptidase [Campylobacterota bacterium]|nr:M23 family metallopeptidase [Campylobacterota bacterium]